MKVELVTTLKRQASNILDELNETKDPVLITQHGKPSAYLLDVETYEQMQRRIDLLETIARGERDILAGRTKTHEEAKERLKQWLK